MTEQRMHPPLPDLKVDDPAAFDGHRRARACRKSFGPKMVLDGSTC